MTTPDTTDTTASARARGRWPGVAQAGLARQRQHRRGLYGRAWFPTGIIAGVVVGLVAGAAIGRANSPLVGGAMLAGVGSLLLIVLWLPTIRAPDRRTDVIGTLGFAFVCGAVPLLTLNALRISYSLSFGDTLLVLGGVFAIARRSRAGVPARSVPVWLPLAVLGILIAGLLAAFRGNVGADLLPTVEFAGTMFGAPVVVMLAVDSPRRAELAVEAWLCAATVSAIVAVLDLKLGLGIGRRLTGIDFVTFTHRAPGLTLHPNHLAVVSAMAMPVAAIRASRRVRPEGFAVANARNLFYVFSLGAGVLASGSRGGLAGAVAGIAVLPILQPGRRRSLALIAVGALTVLALGALTFDSSIASRLGVITGQRLSGQAAGTQLSNDYRTGAYAAAVRETLAHPIAGQGFESVRTAHDIYLQLLQAGGVVAVAAFTVFMSGVLGLAGRLSASPNLSGSLAGLASAFGASFVVWLIVGLVQNELYDRYLYIPVGLLLAVHMMTRGRAADASFSRNLRRDPAPLVSA